MNIKVIKNKARTIFLSLFINAVCISFVFSASPDAKIVTEGNLCVHLVFQERFADAHVVANNLIKQFPDSPAGYFFRAAVFHYQMIYLRKNIYEKQLYEACAKGIQIGEQNKGQSEWNDFFLAATIGVQGNFDRVNGRLVSSLKLAWRSVEIFNGMDENSVIDILYGTGVYDYWVGANAKLLWWMPDVKDNRSRAFVSLGKVHQKGIFTKQIVNYDLMEMYLNEKKYSQVISIATDILEKYPKNSYALWSLYEAYDSMKNNEEKKNISQRISARIQLEKDNTEQLKFFDRKTKRDS